MDDFTEVCWLAMSFRIFTCDEAYCNTLHYQDGNLFFSSFYVKGQIGIQSHCSHLCDFVFKPSSLQRPLFTEELTCGAGSIVTSIVNLRI